MSSRSAAKIYNGREEEIRGHDASLKYEGLEQNFTHE